MSIFEKSEGCQCGAAMTVEGPDEDAVALWCESFRNKHQSCGPKRLSVFDRDFADLKNSIKNDVTDMGELGQYVRIEHIYQRINSLVTVIRGRR